ncbi:MAG: DEAD/DEAH box helicase [Cryomorphaceae bacterium]|nr:DEAD/DEAH box helicase family protein [Flavobacteriales bacterium]
MGSKQEIFTEEPIKELYPYQEEAIVRIFEVLDETEGKTNILFQLPTGGGKTVIFSEIARQFISRRKQKVLILTHRVELSVQTSNALSEIDVKNKIINRDVKELPDREEYDCYVAMVETLNNRLNENENYLRNIGLVIIDEAHYNSFRKLFKFFDNANMLGVTATPLSSNRSLPLNENYQSLIVGHSIEDLIDDGYLSGATTFTFNVNLRSLKVGPDGDYTISSLDRLYSLYSMQDRLLAAYEEKAKGKKTLIFNSGIATSIRVYELFKNAGYPVKHLDSTFSPKDREDTLTWFKETHNAILTSVGILTTGFDEPSVEAIVLNRATRSLTLYHQMIGRGSRITRTKRKFTIIDLGNNVQRLGLWQDYINWTDIFRFPEKYFERINEKDENLLFDYQYQRSQEVMDAFPVHDPEDEFDMKEIYDDLMAKGEKPKKAINMSIDNHARQIFKNTDDYYDALDMIELLQEEIEYRCRIYCNCLHSATDSYFSWLVDTYVRKIRNEVRLELM